MGLPNPWDGKRLGKEIKRGFAARHLPDARKRRDILLGDLRRLEAQQGDKGAFLLPSAFEWREAIAADAAANADDTHGGLDVVLQTGWKLPPPGASLWINCGGSLGSLQGKGIRWNVPCRIHRIPPPRKPFPVQADQPVNGG